MTLEEAIAWHEGYAEYDKTIGCPIIAGKNNQYADWLRELQERRKEPEIVFCKDCAHYHTDVFGGELGATGIWENIIVAHNACDKWAKDMNCVTPDGFCFLAERRTYGNGESN